MKITGRYGIYPPQRIQTAYAGVTVFGVIESLLGEKKRILA